LEPLTLILTALSAGAAAALQETAAAGVKDAYHGLRTLIQQKFGSQPKNNDHLDEYTKDPDTWEKPLARDLQLAAADKDEEILQASKSLLELLQSQSSTGKYNVQISDAQGIVVGEYAKVEMKFGTKPKKKS
jgi:alkyl hydroperoxide reductase subunit AhpF